MAKKHIHVIGDTRTCEEFASYSLNDLIETEYGQVERMEFVVDTSIFGMDPLEAMLLNEKIQTLINENKELS